MLQLEKYYLEKDMLDRVRLKNLLQHSLSSHAVPSLESSFWLNENLQWAESADNTVSGLRINGQWEDIEKKAEPVQRWGIESPAQKQRSLDGHAH